MRKKDTLPARILHALKDKEWASCSDLKNRVHATKRMARDKAVNALIKEKLIESRIKLKAGKGRNTTMLKLTESGIVQHNKIYPDHRIK